MGRKIELCYSKKYRAQYYSTSLYTRNFINLVPIYNKAVYTAKNCRCNLTGCKKYRQADYLNYSKTYVGKTIVLKAT